MAPDRESRTIDYDFSFSDQQSLHLEGVNAPQVTHLDHRPIQPLPVGQATLNVAAELAGQTVLPGFKNVIVEGIQERADRRFFEEHPEAESTPSSPPDSRPA